MEVTQLVATITAAIVAIGNLVLFFQAGKAADNAGARLEAQLSIHVQALKDATSHMAKQHREDRRAQRDTVEQLVSLLDRSL